MLVGLDQLVADGGVVGGWVGGLGGWPPQGAMHSAMAYAEHTRHPVVLVVVMVVHGEPRWC